MKPYFRSGHQDTDNLLVQAHAPRADKPDSYALIVFRLARIDYIYAIDEKISAIKLLDNVTVPVALDVLTLRNRLHHPDFTPDDGFIDLCPVTGPTVKAAQKCALATHFNPTAAISEEKPLNIICFAHAQTWDRGFNRVSFDADNIDYFEPNANRPDDGIYVKLKKPIKGGREEFFIRISIVEFMQRLDTAKKSGAPTLDLADTSRITPDKQLKMD